jgi:hypothetical protein
MLILYVSFFVFYVIKIFYFRMDTDDAEEPSPNVAEPLTVVSALNALEEHPSSQVTADTNIKQPRTLSTIDDVLVNKTQPEPEEELEDNFDYDNTEGAEEQVSEEMAEEEEEVTSARQAVVEMEETDTLENKENSLSNEDERYVRQVVSQLPLSKIKKLMKMDPDTKLVQNDSVVLVAFATELFIKALSTAAAR